MRLLVTGATGFVGGHLLRALRTLSNVSVIGLSRSGKWPAGWDDLVGSARLVSLDMRDRPALRKFLLDEKPDGIIHLAGFAAPVRAAQDPLAAWEGNLTASLYLYQTLAETDLRPRILAAGTGLVYGQHAEGVAMVEDTPFRPNTAYTASKAAADIAGLQYFLHPGLPIIRARPFTHIGPGQTADYAVANFARQIAAIERGSQPPVLETGNLTPRRDMTDVRDIVAAYLLLLEHGEAGQAYNIASGSTISMQEILDQLIALAGVKVEVRPRADLVRSVDLSVPQVDTSRLRSATGWKPTIPLAQTLADILDGWRKLV